MKANHKVQKIEVLATNRGMEVVILAKDYVGCTFLSTLVRINDREARYLGVSVNADRLAQIKRGEITLREAFLNREGAWIDGWAKSPIPNNIDAQVRNDAIPEAYLPPDLPLRPVAGLDTARSLAR